MVKSPKDLSTFYNSSGRILFVSSRGGYRAKPLLVTVEKNFNLKDVFDWNFLKVKSIYHEHLHYLKQYVQAELRENKPYYLSIESRLPVWVKSSKNRTTILKAISKLEQKEKQN